MMKKSFEINIKLSEVFKLNNTGVIYILTNPSFPQYVKIGYANDLKSRLKSLNRSECIPFAFRVYAYYKVPKRLTDLEIHKIIVFIIHDVLKSVKYDFLHCGYSIV